MDFCHVSFSVHNGSDAVNKQLAQREEIQIGNLRNCSNHKQLQGNEMGGIPGYAYLFWNKPISGMSLGWTLIKASLVFKIPYVSSNTCCDNLYVSFHKNI